MMGVERRFRKVERGAFIVEEQSFCGCGADDANVLDVESFCRGVAASVDVRVFLRGG
jgi:hypothetical protein